MQSFTLITSCTHTRTASPIAEVSKLSSGLRMSEAIEEWLALLRSAEPNITPGELYRGLGFSTLTKIVEEFKPMQVKIVTGGQGLIDINEKIVPYDFTADKKERHNIWQKVTAEPFVQSVWWKMINTSTGRSAAPVSKLVMESECNLVLISCSKVFLRYIADDVLSIPPSLWNKVRILLSASSLGSVPAQLRPFIVPFDRSAISHLPGNRNDNNHRAAWKFLELLRDDPVFYTLPNTKQANYLEANVVSGGSSGGLLDSIFKDHPDLLTLTPDEAYMKVKKMYGTVGGRLLFRATHRRLAGITLDVHSDDVDTAANILAGMSLSSNSDAPIEEDEVLRTLKVFAEACRKLPTKPVFSTVDVCSWADRYYRTKNVAIPILFSSPNKLSATLKNNATLLGLQEVSASGGNHYTLI